MDRQGGGFQGLLILGRGPPKDPGQLTSPVKTHVVREPGRLSRKGELLYETDTEVVKSSYPITDTIRHSPRCHPSVVSETQLQPNTKNKGSVYSDILASIGLDSPTSSYETRSEGGPIRHGHKDQTISTPIRNSTTSLVVLGKHVLTPRQGRSWTYGINPHSGDRV